MDVDQSGKLIMHDHECLKITIDKEENHKNDHSSE